MVPSAVRQILDEQQAGELPDKIRRRRVLLVEDDASTRNYLAKLLDVAGYSVVQAESGEQAIALWQSEHPDAVLMDVELPGISGHEATLRIKQLAGEQWVSLIFVTAHGDDETLRECFAAGGDDFLVKPVSAQALEARLAATIRQGDEFREQYAERAELAYFRDMIETEQEVAHKVFRSIMDRDLLDLPNIRYSLSPMSIFNGDLLLVAKKPDGDTNLLIGDFTGHGLAASIGSLPTAEIFYAMTTKGFGIADVMTEINRRLSGLLPIGIFLAACGIEFNHQDAAAQLWSGGIPDLFLRRKGGKKTEQIAAQHVPIGVLGADEFDASVQLIRTSPGDRFYVYTDGVIETQGLAGDQLGLQALRRIVTFTEEGDDVFDRILARVDQFRGGLEQSDDVTLLEYTCPEVDRLEAIGDNPQQVGATRGLGTNWNLNLCLDAEAMRRFDPRPLVTQILIDIQGVFELRQRLFMIISDLYSAVLEHGVLGLSAEQKSDPDQTLTYRNELHARLDALQTGGVAISVVHKKLASGGLVKISMKLQDASSSGVEFGDLLRLKKLSERVTVNSDGSGISVECRWDYLES